MIEYHLSYLFLLQISLHEQKSKYSTSRTSEALTNHRFDLFSRCRTDNNLLCNQTKGWGSPLLSGRDSRHVSIWCYENVLHHCWYAIGMCCISGLAACSPNQSNHEMKNRGNFSVECLSAYRYPFSVRVNQDWIQRLPYYSRKTLRCWIQLLPAFVKFQVHRFTLDTILNLIWTPVQTH